MSKMAELAIERAERASRSGPRFARYGSGERRAGRVVAEYIYLDKRGQNYLRVERTEDKQFPQSHWTGNNWAYGKPAGGKIPYRLPELLAAPPNEPVWCCEGEKDADNVAALGLVATSHSEGAGKWKEELNKWFVGKKVAYIVEDNDGEENRHAGKKCALKRARELSKVMPEVRIVSFADLSGVKDVSDFIEAGGTKEQLLERAQAAQAFQPQEANDPDVAELNAKYALVLIGDKAVIMQPGKGEVKFLALSAFAAFSPPRRGDEELYRWVVGWFADMLLNMNQHWPPIVCRFSFRRGGPPHCEP